MITKCLINSLSIMKKITVLICALFLVGGIFAQEVDMTSKRGEKILPEQGEMALGIDAMPILGFFGDMFNGYNLGNNAAFGFINGLYANNVIYVKYYLEDQVAIRGALRLGYTNWIDQEFVTANQEVPDPLVQVTDKNIFNSTNIGLGADYLMYRGKGRVQGYFGGGAFINYSAWTDKYVYGNQMTTEYQSPAYWDFAGGLQRTGSQRLLKQYNNLDLGLTVRGLIGVEYFFAPKISIGGEMGLGFNLSRDGGYQTIERWTGTEREVVTTKRAVDSFIGIDNFTSGSMFIMFHF